MVVLVVMLRILVKMMRANTAALEVGIAEIVKTRRALNFMHG